MRERRLIAIIYAKYPNGESREEKGGGKMRAELQLGGRVRDVYSRCKSDRAYTSEGVKGRAGGSPRVLCVQTIDSE